MLRSLALSIAILTFGVFCFFCVNHHTPMIQQELTGDVGRALSAQHISSQGMSVDGRDVLLTGPAGSAQVSEAAQTLAAGVEGVRLVSVRATNAGAESLPDARTLTAAKTETQGKLDALLAQDVVEFNPASAEPTPHGRKVLDQVAALLTAAPTGLACEIQGHTDSQGNPEANKELSYRRAIETKNYLVNKGIAPERLTTQGFGDSQPVASNTTAEGRRRNRRINFVLREKS